MYFNANINSEITLETGKFVFCLIAFDLFELLTHLAPQNDRQHLSFVKDINVVGKK